MARSVSVPRLDDLLKGFARDPAMSLRLLRAPVDLPPAFRSYRHWEQVRYHKPLPQGMTAEAWWCALKLLRASTAQELPLLDVAGNPMRLSWPSGLADRLRALGAKLAPGRLPGVASKSTPEGAAQHAARWIDESASSSILEGARTSREDALELLATARPPRDLGERMVANAYAAVRHACASARESWTPSRILDLHRRITAGTLRDPSKVGRLRTEADKVVLRRGDEVVFVPPAASELPGRLQRLCAFVNAEDPASGSLDPVLRAILAHFALAYDHPFVDGNGRTARVLFYACMARAGLLSVEHLSLSGAILEDRKSYYDAFRFVQSDGGDVTYFVLSQLDLLETAADCPGASPEVREGWRAPRRSSGRLPSLPGLNVRQQAALLASLGDPGRAHTLAGHSRAHEVTAMTAWRDLTGLRRAGWLVEVSPSARAHAFVAALDFERRLATAARPGRKGARRG
jgi:Fic family protein